MSVILIVCISVVCKSHGLNARIIESEEKYINFDRGHRICKDYGYDLIKAKFGKEVHLLCLRSKPLGSLPLAGQHSTLLLDPEPEDTTNTVIGLPFADITMAYGFPVNHPSLGTAEGYIGEDHQFYGVLHLGNRTLFADPYGLDDLSKSFGAFENDHMPAPRIRRDYSQVHHDPRYFSYQIEEKKQTPGVARARVCDLLLLADKEFFDKDANSSLSHVVRRMMHAIDQADVIFRNTDFNEDGLPDNIGFSVKYVLVLTSNETNARVFGDVLNDQAIDGKSYLMRFSRLRRLSEVCLGVAFSGHAFLNRTLGLSFTSLGGGMWGAAGGLCDRRAYGRSFNTLAIAHATTETKTRVPERVAALTLTHEMGHSFGAYHDDNFPNPECQGYLMGSQSSGTGSPLNLDFSKCSKRLIAATLNSMSYCLLEEDTPYCGNGIVEKGEACDCGLPSRCVLSDPCCTPRGGSATVFEEETLHKEGCSVAPSARCHPSQGLCCTPTCEVANLTDSGIDCSTQDQECTCAQYSTDCHCGLGGLCLPDGSCHAAECVTLGLSECQCERDSIPEYKRKREIHFVNKTCSVCCKMTDQDTRKEICVTAITAARKRNAEEFETDYIDGNDYIETNITSQSNQNSSKGNGIRTWREGGVCVAMNAVGICSAEGICELDNIGPRSNMYPDIMNIQLTGFNNKSEGTKLNQTKFLYICVYTITFLFTVI